MKELLEAGVHFGHQVRRWNPKMKEYIFGERNGIYIIDLQKTQKLFNTALAVVEQTVADGGHVLFVATKKQAQDIIVEEAERAGQFHVHHRWLGGMLTNYQTVKQSIAKLKKIEKMAADDPVWQAKYYGFNLFSEDKIVEKLTYMHQNPVRAGLVEQPCDWRWSSARWYEQRRTVGVPITPLD